jgi:hypothetical protein
MIIGQTMGRWHIEVEAPVPNGVPNGAYVKESDWDPEGIQQLSPGSEPWERRRSKNQP